MAVKAKMETLEARKIEIAAKLQDAPEQKPALHPAMAEIYRAKVERLSQSLNGPDLQTEAVEILRGLVETITMTPEEDGYAILLKGDLAGILTLAAGTGNTARTAGGGAQSPSSQVSLVAGRDTSVVCHCPNASSIQATRLQVSLSRYKRVLLYDRRTAKLLGSSSSRRQLSDTYNLKFDVVAVTCHVVEFESKRIATENLIELVTLTEACEFTRDRIDTVVRNK